MCAYVSHWHSTGIQTYNNLCWYDVASISADKTLKRATTKAAEIISLYLSVCMYVWFSISYFVTLCALLLEFVLLCFCLHTSKGVLHVYELSSHWMSLLSYQALFLASIALLSNKCACSCYLKICKNFRYGSCICCGRGIRKYLQ